MKLEEMAPEDRAALERLGDAMADRLEQVGPQPGAAGEPPLVKLRRLAYQREWLEREAAEAALGARLEGVSWERIGAAYGITGETARKRYRRRAA
ncbi:MAG: hypothetical protein LBG60_16265 [Bifidobacteriaceae bacterium]|jgi:hypothetical protein|nr:hypothetical protein [Bifidobacteriaceae bacterium]